MLAIEDRRLVHRFDAADGGGNQRQPPIVHDRRIRDRPRAQQEGAIDQGRASRDDVLHEKPVEPDRARPEKLELPEGVVNHVQVAIRHLEVGMDQNGHGAGMDRLGGTRALERQLDLVRQPEVVAVAEHRVRRLRRFGKAREVPHRRARPLRQRQKFEAAAEALAIAAQDIDGAVGRPVVADEQPEILLRLRQQRIEKRRQECLAVIDGKQDIDGRNSHPLSDCRMFDASCNLPRGTPASKHARRRGGTGDVRA